MDELVRWLGEQLDEDEQIARAAREAEFCKNGHWTVKGPFEEGLGAVHSEAGEAILGEEESVPFSIAVHIARHDPARVLREIDAKRRVITGLQHLFRGDDPFVSSIAEDSLRVLAEPYADRPGYRDEWRP